MKTAMILNTLGLLATSAAAAVVVPRQSHLAFLHMNASRIQCDKQATGKPKGHGYGKDKCPCVGIDNLRGYFSVTLDFHHAQYPMEMGASCGAWELSLHPECKGEPMPKWCRQSWCYVDPCHCELDVPPRRTTLGITYQGSAAYYSYQTCKGFDFWTTEKNPDACVLQKDSGACSSKPNCAWNGKQCLGKEAVQVCGNTQQQPVATYGQTDCRCVGFGGKTNGQAVRYINDHESVPYNSNVGSTCNAWEMDAHPDCKTDGIKPAWCSQKWCFVDPCKCNLAKPPRAVMRANSYERFQGKTAYFSYETCGSVDHWTDTMKEEYCHTYATEATCKTVKKCTWTGEKCMGKALGAICKEQKATGILGMEYDDDDDEGGANSFRPLAGFLIVIGVLISV